MKLTPAATVESDGKTVWVNAAVCLARFSKMGIDVHKDEAGQLASDDQCLDCKSGPCGISDWRQFQDSVFVHHKIVVSDAHAPKYIGLAADWPKKGVA